MAGVHAVSDAFKLELSDGRLVIIGAVRGKSEFGTGSQKGTCLGSNLTRSIDPQRNARNVQLSHLAKAPKRGANSVWKTPRSEVSVYD